MKLKALLVAGAILAIAAPFAGAKKPEGANGNTRDSVTGGGQTFFDGTDPASATGAGDTVAFTAKRERGAADDSEAATGQIQVNRRTTSAIKFHGYIKCLNVSSVADSDAAYAYMSGTTRAGDPFELFVQDGGKGAQEKNDLIMLYHGAETANNDSDNEDANDVCGFEDFTPSEDALTPARGNVQVRNRNTTEDDDPDPGTEAMAATLALF